MCRLARGAAKAPGDEEEADGSVGAKAFVVVLSDANFRRYRMDPAWWSQALTKDPRVEGHAVMLGSLGDEAERIKASLPAGRGHVVMDTATLPQTFRRIFQHARLFEEEF
mmetsp:Transcript_4967/g.15572  ORF Transcript_4967/g.15572 Transcript_4967/m.15572 type:complete len:110 (+) Transcript_4967:1-330(+)